MIFHLQRKKSTGQALISLFVVAMLFLATVGIPLSELWCCGKVVSLRLYEQASSCGMMVESIPDNSTSVGEPVSTCCRDILALQSAQGLDSDGILASFHSHVPQAFTWMHSDESPKTIALADTLDQAPYPIGPPDGFSLDFQRLYQVYLI